MILTKEDLYSTKSYQQGDLSGIKFDFIDMSEWDFSHQNLTGCQFSNCNLAGARFEDTVITGVRIINSQGPHKTSSLKPDQIKSTWNYKQNRMEGVVLPKDVADALRGKQP